jgi:hypothetical protein
MFTHHAVVLPAATSSTASHRCHYRRGQLNLWWHYSTVQYSTNLLCHLWRLLSKKSAVLTFHWVYTISYSWQTHISSTHHSQYFGATWCLYLHFCTKEREAGGTFKMLVPRWGFNHQRKHATLSHQILFPVKTVHSSELFFYLYSDLHNPIAHPFYKDYSFLLEFYFW